ncbi:MAG: gas vesicle protein GvpG, partial [Myxococcales bacterium]
MLIIDDLIAAPFKGIFWVFKKIHQAAMDELENRQRQTRSELSELYMLLETGKITEAEFDAREKELLDRLDEIKKMREGPP